MRRLIAAVLPFIVSATMVAAQQPQQQGQAGRGSRGGQAGQGQQTQGPGQTGQGQGNGRRQARDTSANAAQQPTGTAAVSGSVVSSDGSRPVRRARITLSGGDLRSSKVATTDDMGRFAFTALAAGRYTLSGSKAGYVNATYGQKKPGRPGTPIQIADGQQVDNLKLTLPKGGVLTGTVLDENGEPTPGTQVTAWRAEMRTGEKRFVQAGSDQTDDRGIYRIYGLLPGDYLVRATPRNALGDLRQAVQDIAQAVVAGGRAGGAGAGPGGGGRGGGALGDAGLGRGGLQQLLGGRGGQAAGVLGNLLGNGDDVDTSVGYAPVYYPGTTTSTGATSLALGVSEERQGIDFQLQLVQTAKVSGTVTSPDGDTAGVILSLINETEQALGSGLNTTRVQQDGSFSFTNVAPGQYVLQARAFGGRGRRGGGGGAGGFGGGRGQAAAGEASTPVPEPLWGETTVTVNGQPVSNLSVRLQTGMHVSGQVTFEGGTPPADLTRVRVVLSPAGPSQLLDFAQNAPAPIDASGRFTITGVAPGHYTVRVQGQVQGFAVKSAISAGRDALDFPLDVRANQDIPDLDVVMTTQTQELSGTMTDASNMPAVDYTVIIFAADERYWVPQSRRIVSARPGTDGKFIARNLPAGEYYIAAVTDVEPGEWFDPEYLKQLRAAAARVTLNPGDKKVQDVRLSGGA